MYWCDLGIVLGWRVLGEQQRLLTLLTQQYGLYRGMIYGVSQTLMPGWILHVTWKGLSETRLGTFKVDDRVPLCYELYNHSLGFLLLESMCQLCMKALHPQIPCLDIYQAFLVSMTLLPEVRGLRAYVLFEAHILCYLGYEDAQVQFFIQNWQDPNALGIQAQWIHQEKIWNQLGKPWQEWTELKNRIYKKIFETCIQ